MSQDPRDQDGDHGPNPFVPGDMVVREGHPGLYRVILSKRDSVVMKPAAGEIRIISDNFWYYRKAQ